MTVFQILTGESWSEVAYQAMASEGKGTYIFFVILIILGVCLILNLFIAVLSDGFSSRRRTVETSSDAEVERSVIHILTDPIKMLGVGSALHNVNRGAGTVLQITRQTGDDHLSSTPTMWAIAYADTDKAEEWFTEEELVEVGEANELWVFDSDYSDEYQAHLTRDLIARTVTRAQGLERGTKIFKTEMSKRVRAEMIDSGCSRGRSLLFLPADGSVRRLTHSLFTNPVFEHFVLLAICFSSLLVAFNHPQEGDQLWIQICDWALTLFFTLEMLIKIVDMGLVHDKQSYLRSYWNMLDAFIVFISILTLILQEVRSLRTLRVFRALRPLRLISRAPGLRLIVNCILRSLKPCLNVVGLCFLVRLICVGMICGFAGMIGSFRCSCSSLCLQWAGGRGNSACVESQMNGMQIPLMHSFTWAGSEQSKIGSTVRVAPRDGG